MGGIQEYPDSRDEIVRLLSNFSMGFCATGSMKVTDSSFNPKPAAQADRRPADLFERRGDNDETTSWQMRGRGDEALRELF